MTFVKLKYSKNPGGNKNLPLSLEINNHSGYAVEGSDIVCAAVSSASEFFINTLNDFFGANCAVKIKADPPILTVEFSSIMEISNRFPALRDSFYMVRLIESFILHIENIGKDYPENLKMIKEYI